MVIVSLALIGPPDPWRKFFPVCNILIISYEMMGLTSREPSPKTDIEDLKLTEKDPKKVPNSDGFGF